MRAQMGSLGSEKGVCWGGGGMGSCRAKKRVP